MESCPCLEIDPVRTLMVLGPQVTAQCLGDGSTHHHLSYRLLAESGIKTALEMESFDSKEDRTRKETLLRHAYELEPAFASSKVVEVLRSHGQYENWLKQTFSTASVKRTEKGNAILQHLLALRQEGVRLAYTHYDEMLSRALGLPPVIMEDAESVKKWSQGFPALLHLHGAAVHPQSVMFDCLSYETTVGGSPSADVVLEQFRNKTVIFVGFDDIYFDPFLPKLVKTFAKSQEAKLACPPLFLSATMTTRPSGVLPLPVGPISDIHHYIRSSSTNFKTASSQAPILFQFVFTSQAASQGFLDKLQKTVESSSLSPMAGTVGNHFVVLLQVPGPTSILRVWEAMFKDTVKMSDLSCLLAAALQDRFTVWLKHGDSEPSPGRIQNGVTLPPVLLPSSTSSANGFIPIPVPVSSWKPFSAISFSPQFALACNTQKHLELAQQQLQAIQHEKIRRIQSENDKLSFQDQVNNSRKSPSRNGFLVHQQSAPTIPISPAVMLNTADVQKSLLSPIAVPSPSILMNLDQKLKEHRIERIEQQPHVPKQDWKEDSSTHTRGESDGGEVEKDQKDTLASFEDQRKKFIEEARNFSATVGTWIQQQELGTPGAASLPVSSDSFQEVGRHFEQLQRITLGAAATGMPLVPLGVPGGLMSLPLHSPSTTSSSMLSPSTPSVGSHSPKVQPVSQQQQSPAIVPLITNPHSAAGMVTLLQPNLPLSSLASTVFSPQLPVFMTPPASSKSSTSSDPASVPVALPVSTAVNEHQPFGGEQKVMVLMPNGSVVPMAMPSAIARVPGSPVVVKQEEDKGEVFVQHAPKRTGSPNSDTVYHSKPPLKRRRSSSLPDVSLGSTAKTPSTLSPTSPVPSSPSQTIGNGMLTGEGGPAMVQFPPSLLLSRIPSSIMQDQEKSECSPLESSSLHPVPPGRGPIQLWQFLLDLLMTQDKAHMIQWTGNGYEFRIIQPEEIAKLWGARKNKPRMNYDKLSRGLRYYYSKGIMDKVPGKKLTFKYTCDIQQYMMQKSGSANSHPAHTKTVPTIAV